MGKVFLKAKPQRQKNSPQDQGTRDVTEARPCSNPQGPPHGPPLGSCEDRNGHPVIGQDRMKESHQKSGQQEQKQRGRHGQLLVSGQEVTGECPFDTRNLLVCVSITESVDQAVIQMIFKNHPCNFI